MKAWLKFVAEATTPSAFKNDPYSAATNQAGHAWHGLLVGVIVFFVFYEVIDAIPAKWVVLVVALLPGLFLEVRQGWRGADTAWDLWFRMVGILVVVTPLTEQEIGSGALVADPAPFAVCLLAYIVTMAIHLHPRVQRKYG